MTLPNLKPEQELSVILARKCLTPQLAGHAESVIGKGLNWDAFLDLSVKHRVFPIVFGHLQKFRPGLVPERVLNLLRTFYLANAEKNDAMAEELAEIVWALRKAGIEAVPFKGPLLGKLVWGDHRLWVGEDLDLLLRNADLKHAEDILRGAGYRTLSRSETRPKGPWFRLGRSEPFAVLKKSSRIGTILVDFQTSLFPWWIGRKEMDEEVWEDVRPGNIFGASGVLLPPSWNFILLCLHAYKHSFILLRWAAELYELWNSVNADRDTILTKSEKVGVREEVVLSVAVCESVLGEGGKASVPADKVLVRKLSGNVFRQSLSAASAAFLRLRLPGSLVRKARCLTIDIFCPSPAEERLLPLPRCLRPLRYVIRPTRVAIRYGLERPLVHRQEL